MAISFRLVVTAGFTLAVLSTTAPILALSKPAVVTSTYEVLDPETWVGKELPILEYIDIADQLKEGTWLLLFYHYDCPDCQEAIPQYQQVARSLSGNEDFLQMAFVEIPPYGPSPLRGDSGYYALGHLGDVKEWFVTTPVAALMATGKVRAVWEDKALDLDAILAEIAECERKTAKSPDLRVYIDPVRNALY